MLNIEDFIKRLEFIMEHFSLNASSFADKINVQRSSISHLLSGRNKPSLDFVMKIFDVFPELNLYWLLDGSGTYLKNDKIEQDEKKPDLSSTPIIEIETKKANPVANEVHVEINDGHLNQSANSLFEKSTGKHIQRIVLFYTDGTFENYSPSNTK
jgi:transcriptional regulator with XRE-family HTH domain